MELRHCHAVERWYPRAVVSLLEKWFTGCDPGDGTSWGTVMQSRWYPRAVVSLLEKWFTGCDPGDVACYVLMKIICPMGFKVAWGLSLGAVWAILPGWSWRPKWAWISRCRTSRNCLYYFNVLYTKIKLLMYDVLLSKVVI